MYNCEAVKIDHCPMSKTMHCMKKIKKISVSEETFLKQIENLKKIFLKIWSSDFTVESAITQQQIADSQQQLPHSIKGRSRLTEMDKRKDRR